MEEINRLWKRSQEEHIYLVVNRGNATTTVSVSVNSRRHSGPTTPAVTATVEHGSAHPLLLRLVSDRENKRPVVVDSFHQDSGFRYVFLMRCKKVLDAPRHRNGEGERMTRSQMPVIGFVTRQFVSATGGNITALDEWTSPIVVRVYLC